MPVNTGRVRYFQHVLILLILSSNLCVAGLQFLDIFYIPYVLCWLTRERFISLTWSFQAIGNSNTNRFRILKG